MPDNVTPPEDTQQDVEVRKPLDPRRHPKGDFGDRIKVNLDDAGGIGYVEAWNASRWERFRDWFFERN